MMPAVCLLVAAAALVLLAVLRHNYRKQLREMDAVLDAAIAGHFSVDTFDETQVSKLSAKLARYLSSAKLHRAHLEEEQTKIRSMISDISHQTKTPIANVLLYTQLLQEQPELSQESLVLAEQVRAGAQKLSFLVDALVKSSRLESGVVQIQPQQAALYPMVMRAAAEVSGKAQEKNIALILPEKTEICAAYDPKWCGEAIYNILDNAVKYTPPGGAITISLHQYELFSCIRIADSGRGISEADLPKIFTRFYRSCDSAAEEGVGIGLYLAREIVQKCGGYIQVSAKMGKGAVFSVYLSKL